MKNYIAPGANLTIAAPYAVDSGELVVAGAIVGVAAGDAENGADVDVVTEGVFTLPKVPAVVFTLGEVAYTTTAGGPLTDNSDADSNSGAAVKVGIVVEAAGAGVTTAKVKLVPVI